jgi:hypothetical protein
MAKPKTPTATTSTSTSERDRMRDEYGGTDMKLGKKPHMIIDQRPRAATLLLSAAVLAILGPWSAAAQAQFRAEKAFGICVEVPAKLFPKRAYKSTRNTDKGPMPEVSIDGPKKRNIIIAPYDSYDKLLALEVPGFVTEYMHVDKVTPGNNEYSLTGYWVEDLKNDSGAWQRKAFRQDDGSAAYIDFFVLRSDLKNNAQLTNKMIASARRC